MEINDKIKEIKDTIQDVNKLKNIEEFYTSLINATESSGGDTKWIKEDSTIKDLAEHLAVNGVRFTYFSKDQTYR